MSLKVNCNIETLKNAVNQGFSDTELVGFLLNEHEAFDKIEWNKFGFLELDYSLSDDEQDEWLNNEKSEAINIYDWYRVENHYTDIFRYSRFPTFTFMGSTWVLKTFYDINFYSEKWIITAIDKLN